MKAKNQPKEVDYSKPLKNAKYEAFCQEYMRDSNKAQAAIRAGYSEKRANSKGVQLWTIISIKGRIKHLQGVLAKNCGVTAERLMEEWKKIGFANLKNVVKMGNNIRDISQLPDDVAAAISSVATSKTGVKITMHSKETALENMGKGIGFYREDNEQKKSDFDSLLEAINGKTKGLPEDRQALTP